MAWDLPVEGRLFVAALALLFLAPLIVVLLASTVTPSAPNQELDWYASLTFGAGVLLILSYVYGRTATERTRVTQSGQR